MRSMPSAKTPRAIAIGNLGCVSGDLNPVGLNRIERANAGIILKGEQALDCPE